MKLADFKFTIGYNGSDAVVDKQAERGGAKSSVKELTDKGYYKPAFCTALYNNDEEGIQYIMDTYNKVSGSSYHTLIQLKRLFGVYAVPETISRAKRI